MLTAEDKFRLTIWKWCYTMEADHLGFSHAEMLRLCFHKWLYHARRAYLDDAEAPHRGMA